MLSLPKHGVRNRFVEHMGRIEKKSALPAVRTELDVCVIPRARRSGIDGMRGDAILVRLQSAPVDGAANAELIDLIAAALDVPKRSVTIVSGEKSRLKRLQVTGLDETTVHARLAIHGSDR